VAGTLATLVVGAILTVLVSGHYYRRGMRHHIGIYILSETRVFDFVEADVKKRLTITFNKKSVTDVSSMTFVIVNEGAHPIRDVLAPLTLKLPEPARLLDASIVQVEPAARRVEISPLTDAPGAAFLWDLLNPKELFIVKVLVDGSVGVRDIRFGITAEHLPPSLVVESAAEIAWGDARRVEPAAFGLAVPFLLAGAAMSVLLSAIRDARPEVFTLHNFTDHASVFVAIVLVALSAAVSVIIGLGMLAAGTFGGILPPRRRLPIPAPSAVAPSWLFDLDASPVSDTRANTHGQTIQRHHHRHGL
jgi:hypothetical protein